MTDLTKRKAEKMTTMLGSVVGRGQFPITEEQEEAIYDPIESGDHDDLVTWLRGFHDATPCSDRGHSTCGEVLDALEGGE